MPSQTALAFTRSAFFPVLAATLALSASPASADLPGYIAAPDESFRFEVKETRELPGLGQAVIVEVTSQTWQGIPWRHWLSILRPENVTHPEHALLVISGGSVRKDPPNPFAKEGLVVAQVAQRTGSYVAVLGQVPNQPLFDNLKEDGLIAHSFVKYLETGDATWPCLLPMTKSAVRAMDVVQKVVKEKFAQEVQRFVVTGASKRGWTTWLTGATDPRVEAIAPMVIDTLNMAQQMRLQKLSFGGFSEQIKDYTERGLQDRLADPAAKKLLDLVDPYAFLDRLTIPKLVVLGTNDRYWPVDAAKLYFPELKGEKHLHYVPNAGHGLGPGAVEAVGAFYQLVVEGKARPRFEWAVERGEAGAKLVIKPTDVPVRCELWQAASPTRDFREAKWTAREVARGEAGAYSAAVSKPEKGFAAFHGRLTYKAPSGGDYALSTSLEVLGDPVEK